MPKTEIGDAALLTKKRRFPIFVADVVTVRYSTDHCVCWQCVWPPHRIIAVPLSPTDRPLKHTDLTYSDMRACSVRLLYDNIATS